MAYRLLTGDQGRTGGSPLAFWLALALLVLAGCTTESPRVAEPARAGEEAMAEYLQIGRLPKGFVPLGVMPLTATQLCPGVELPQWISATGVLARRPGTKASIVRNAYTYGSAESARQAAQAHRSASVQCEGFSALATPGVAGNAAEGQPRFVYYYATTGSLLLVVGAEDPDEATVNALLPLIRELVAGTPPDQP